MTNSRAVKYRRSALAEQDQNPVRLLLQLAEETERGILVTAGLALSRDTGALANC
jgi:hypothetical protein